ncbi:MAG: hypothetical protein ABFC95_10595, partial [Smithella sp.]
SNLDFEKARREELRWLILRTLYAAQPIGTSETLIQRTVEPVVTGATEMEIRNNLDYLAERKLIHVEKNKPVWTAKINLYGIDVVEYTVDCDPGIARPAKW